MQKSLLLTGASRGIGHATVKKFSKEGWRELTDLAHLVIVSRPGQVEAYSDRLAQVLSGRRVSEPDALFLEPAGRVYTLPVTARDVSSTGVRKALEAGQGSGRGAGQAEEQLEGDGAAEGLLDGFVDDPHAAAAQLAAEGEVAQPLRGGDGHGSAGV